MKQILAPLIFLVVNFAAQWFAAMIYEDSLRSLFPPHIFIIFLAFHVLFIIWLIVVFARQENLTRVEFSLLVILLIMITFLVFFNNINYYSKFSRSPDSYKISGPDIRE